ncbi:hypothetical protein ALC56_01889 [Trachymyrmex septentrionalis]|uniref:Uncharacterized protein n=1 Tax=Trachymyrmex septentrionalis TaxID=34720 RepID=A0A195FTL0_9HYME|nr:hypothetical protein ALC56_01889 [Trachymyrmex septentrionalis]
MRDKVSTSEVVSRETNLLSDDIALKLDGVSSSTRRYDTRETFPSDSNIVSADRHSLEGPARNYCATRRCQALRNNSKKMSTSSCDFSEMSVEGMVADRQMSATEGGGRRNPGTDINANVIIASHEGEKKAKKKPRRNREDECNEKGSFYSFLEVTRVLVYQFMRFEFNQRTRLTGGTRKFSDIRCKNFSEASRLYRRNVPYVRVMCPESPRPAMRVRSRCRLQLLELGEDHVRFGSGGIARFSESPGGTKVHSSKVPI